MLRLWLEWDYGQDDFVFRSTEDVLAWMRTTTILEDLADDEEINTVEDIFEVGLAGFELVTIYKPQ